MFNSWTKIESNWTEMFDVLGVTHVRMVTQHLDDLSLIFSLDEVIDSSGRRKFFSTILRDGTDGEEEFSLRAISYDEESGKSFLKDLFSAWRE